MEFVAAEGLILTGPCFGHSLKLLAGGLYLGGNIGGGVNSNSVVLTAGQIFL